MTIDDAIRKAVEALISEKGRGYTASRKEIVDRVVAILKVSRDSVVPSDYCYNRVNHGIDFSKPTFFQYKGRDAYVCLGEGDTSYTGEVSCRPLGSRRDRPAGFCVKGVRKSMEAWYQQAKDDGLVRKSEKRQREPHKVRIGEAEAWARDPRVVDEALKVGRCACCGTKKTFSKENGKQYMEVHHLLPVAACQDAFKPVNLDVVANVVCVCPQCHRFLHYGREGAVRKMLSDLFDKRIHLLSAAGIVVDKATFLKCILDARGKSAKYTL